MTSKSVKTGGEDPDPGKALVTSARVVAYVSGHGLEVYKKDVLYQWHHLFQVKRLGMGNQSRQR